MIVETKVVLAVLLALAPYRPDVKAHVDRKALLIPVASAIAHAARNYTEAAALIALGKHETSYAAYVVTGHCKDGPKGARCDGGLARGPWQVWSWCREGWAAPDGSSEALAAQALCARRMLSYAYHRCAGKNPSGDFAGMYSGYAGMESIDACKRSWAKRRAATLVWALE